MMLRGVLLYEARHASLGCRSCSVPLTGLES